MANFDEAIPLILKHEGGYVNDPTDRGGATKYGISLRWLASQGLAGDFDGDGDVDVDDIRSMTEAQAIATYHTAWWVPNRYTEINDQAVATKVFDLAVNMGPTQAHKLLQRALVRLTQPIKVDGRLGDKSIRAVNSVSAHSLLATLRDEAGDFYTTLADRNPELNKYLRGWLKRAMA